MPVGEGFRNAKVRLLAALRDGSYRHEARGDIDVKNALATGELSVAEVEAIVGRCNGTHHSTDRHHAAPDIVVHVLRRDGWYIKFYFLDPDAWFISVHR